MQADDQDVCDGAYTCRFVTATDEVVAARHAVDALQQEEAFQLFRPVTGQPLRVEVESVRAASVFEGRLRTPGWILYAETAGEHIH